MRPLPAAKEQAADVADVDSSTATHVHHEGTMARNAPGRTNRLPVRFPGAILPADGRLDRSDHLVTPTAHATTPETT
jgi:hypothetical protein